MNVYLYLFVGWLVVFVFNNVLLYMESISDLTIRWLTKLKYMQLKSFFKEYQNFSAEQFQFLQQQDLCTLHGQFLQCFCFQVPIHN